MKKLLLCTTALASLVASSAFAADGNTYPVNSANNNLQVTLGGSATFESGHVNQDKDHKKNFSFSPNQSSSALYTKSKLYVKAEGKGDNNVIYGAVVRVQTVANGSNGASDTRNDRTHIYMDTDAGTVQLGSNSAASKLMALNAGTIASATGGIDGDFSTFAAADLSGYNGMGLTGVDNLYNNLDRRESSRKVTYLSPRISGVQFGVSYTQDQANSGDSNVVTQRNNQTVNYINNTYLGSSVRLKNIWSLGLSYSNTFANDVSLALSATTDMGRRNNKTIDSGYTEAQIKVINSLNHTNFELSDINNTTPKKDLKSYSLGTVVGYNGFSVAGSYTDDGTSLISKAAPNGFKSSWWTAGIAYQTGPMSTSLTYLEGKKGYSNRNLKTQLVSLGVDYEVMPGMKPFAEVTKATYTPSNKTTNTKAKATVFIFGTKVKF